MKKRNQNKDPLPFQMAQIRKYYRRLPGLLNKVRYKLNRPLTYAEKIFYANLAGPIAGFIHGEDFVNLNPQLVLLQDATAQMSILQYILSGKKRVAVPSYIFCDHLITAREGSLRDLETALGENAEVYRFLESAARKNGMGFWRPGSGIIHQIALENHHYPGCLAIGTDSHTPTGGGIGSLAIGVGGGDAAMVMGGLPMELLFPKIVGIKLIGKLNPWVSAKDVVLHLLGRLSVKGGTNKVFEYFGEGCAMLSATARSTMCNVGAEFGATTSIFSYDANTYAYLCSTGRQKVADLCEAVKNDLMPDAGCVYDEVVEINLSDVSPMLNGPLTPDAAHTIQDMKLIAEMEGWPLNISACLVGSCTNSSFEDLCKVAHVCRQALAMGLTLKTELMITPGSQKVYELMQRYGLLDVFAQVGATVLANACGPCIGMWARMMNEEKNTVLHAFNRNFARRVDGNPNTLAFIGSAELVTAMAFTGDLRFDPTQDFLLNNHSQSVKFDAPIGDSLPEHGFPIARTGYVPPAKRPDELQIIIDPNSNRLQFLEPFAPITSFANLHVLLKAKGKLTTDHISPAGSKWLVYRGHLPNISRNCYIGAENFFTQGDEENKNKVWNSELQVFQTPYELARYWQEQGKGMVVFGEHNVGEGSSREHAALEPRFLGVRAVIVKSFARIHKTNLKLQGVLALTFAEPEDYDKILVDDQVSILGVDSMMLGTSLVLFVQHQDGTSESIMLSHDYNEQQFLWLKSGSALNAVRAQVTLF